MYESKEALLTILSIILLAMGVNKILKLLLLLAMIMIRPMYFIVYIASQLTKNGAAFYLNKNSFVFLSAISAMLTVYLLETYNLTTKLIGVIRASFLPYAQATTNRDWVPFVDSILSTDFLIWYSLGLYTVFLGKLELGTSTLLFFTAGLGKLLLLTKVTKKRLNDSYIWFLAISIYTVPLAVYNVGSALRYSIPLFVVLLFVFMTPRNKEE
jgi:hypothetical protein